MHVCVHVGVRVSSQTASHKLYHQQLNVQVVFVFRQGQKEEDGRTPGRTLRMMFKCEVGDSDERGQGGCLGREEEQGR